MSFEHLVVIFSMLLKLTGLWLFVTSLFFLKRLKPYPKHAPRTRFACLIAARNEEEVIGGLVSSLVNQTYPKALFDVYVIPNNCTDNTEDAARKAGASIITCCAPVRCKGDALRQAVGQLMGRGYDAFCVFDADNLVHPDFLAEMNSAFEEGASVAKARMLTKNPHETWVSGCYALYHGLFETVYNRSRAAIGLSAKLVGTGFAVHRRVFEKTGGWQTRTIAEDAEFAAVCASMGERVVWVPKAITFDEAPTSFRISLIQRSRWMSGIVEVARLKLPDLWQTLIRNRPEVSSSRGGSLRLIDALVFLCLPYIQVIRPVPAILLFFSPLGRALPARLFSLLSLSGGSPYLAMALTGLAVSYLALAALGLFTALLSDRRGRFRNPAMIRSVLLFPVFMASWLPLTYLAFIHRTTTWQPIRHTGRVRVRDLA